MKPVSPVIPNENHKEVVVAEHQDEYQNLPAIFLGDGSILTRWQLTEEEKQHVLETGDVYLQMYTFGKPVTPVLLMAKKPKIIYEEQS
jgi:hypothetical protein